MLRVSASLAPAAKPRDPLPLRTIGSRQRSARIQEVTVNLKEADRAVAHPPTPGPRSKPESRQQTQNLKRLTRLGFLLLDKINLSDGRLDRQLEPKTGWPIKADPDPS
jgi:hypothetical protein